jgi:heme A synthase
MTDHRVWAALVVVTGLLACIAIGARLNANENDDYWPALIVVGLLMVWIALGVESIRRLVAR